MVDEARSTTVAPPSKKSMLAWMIPLMLVLALVSGVIWMTRPKPTAVYEPPPPRVKSVAEVEKEIAEVKANNHIPAGQKGRILGFLQMDLEKAKQNQ